MTLHSVISPSVTDLKVGATSLVRGRLKRS